MKRERIGLLISLSLILCTVISAQAQSYEVSLEQQIYFSPNIVEGKVVAQHCFWNPDKDLIYTSHKIEVYKSFKGEGAKTIDIITLGGQLDGYAIKASSEAQLRIGDIGIFMLKKSKALTENIGFEIVSADQGFYRYDLANNKALNSFVSRKNIRSNFYGAIIAVTQKPVTELKPFNVDDYKRGKQLKSTQSPSINTLSPLTATAGTQTVLTITGTDFGDTKGKIEFKNANDGGASYIEALETEIVSWNDALVEVQIPSHAGNGNIRLIDTSGVAVESIDEIAITYAITNTVDSGYAVPTQLIDVDAQGGYLWHMHVDFDANTPAKEAFTRAMNTWVCASKVNWKLGLPTNNDETKGDGENVIRFDNGDELPMGVLGRCLSYSFICGTPKKDAIIEIDMIVNDDVDWSFSPENPSANQFDFETVVLHELGHGHQLGHVMDSSDVMYYGLYEGEVKRTFSENDLAGAAFIHNRSTTTTVCFLSAMQDLACPVTGIKQAQFDEQFKLYPSPATTTLYIYKAAELEVEEIAIFDLHGRKLKTIEQKYQNTIPIDVSALPAGYYLLNLTSNKTSFSKQFLVK